MKRNTWILSVLALVLIVCAAVQPALAYFTDHDRADGAVPLTLTGKTEIRDDYKDYLKTIAIENTEGRPVWIRLRVLAGETYRKKLVLTPGDGWTYRNDDGCWYYGSPVPAGGATSSFTVDISGIPTEDVDIAEQSFNIAAIYESTPVEYNADGSTKDANWDIQLDVGETAPAGGAEGGEGNG